MSLSNLRIKIKGHVLIRDKFTHEVLLDTENAIHTKNMALALVKGLTKLDTNNCFIHSMKFGNGGTLDNQTSGYTLKSPNVDNPNATLYNQTYEEILNPSSAGYETGNYITYQNDPDVFPVIVCVAEISSSQPSSQLGAEATVESNMNNEFAFDELGLFTKDGKMLSHVTFPPRLKTAGKQQIVTYTLTLLLEE